MGKYVEWVLQYKDNDYYIIFYSSNCGYSIRLKNFLKDNNIQYKGYDFAKCPDKWEELLEDLKENAEKISFDINHRTKPIVFFKKEFVGGSDDTIKLLSNELNQMERDQAEE